jgi:hypothetical protein
LAPVRAALVQRGQAEPLQDGLAEQADALAATMPAPPAVETLCTALGLSPFERSVLLLCAGFELDAEIASLCAAAQGGSNRPPTFSLALSTLPGPHWSALAPAAPLRRWRLVEHDVGDALTTAPLRLDERVLHYLVGIQYVDDRLDGIVGPQLFVGEIAPSHDVIAGRITAAWRKSAVEGMPTPLVTLVGGDREARSGIAAKACASAGVRLHMLHADLIPNTSVEREAARRLCMREGLLSETAFLFEMDTLAESGAPTTAALRFIERFATAAFVSAPAPIRELACPSLVFDVVRPTASEQRARWEQALGGVTAELDGQLDAIVRQFDLDARGVAAAQLQLANALANDREADLAVEIWNACRMQARTALDDLAQWIEVRAGWDDIVLPALQLETLRTIVANVRHRARVYDRWGFAQKGSRGLGISALFAGPTGTGKTMAAEVLARELHLDLYRIDLSAVVSKYIGETEKNLRRVFDAAEAGGAILLFDEADALFGKRTEVKDSHDRYANIEVSYLLQRMEAYRGLAILTTNFRGALDHAFMRRLRFVVDFPFPNAEQRREIWRRIFPRETPTEQLDMVRLAQLNVAGGNIRNIALQAAFLAADDRHPVRMEHIRRAARSEYAKLERPLAGAELGGWE